jgi:hypothetical protein
VNGFEIFGKWIFKELSVKNHKLFEGVSPSSSDLVKLFKKPQKAH